MYPIFKHQCEHGSTKNRKKKNSNRGKANWAAFCEYKLFLKSWWAIVPEQLFILEWNGRWMVAYCGTWANCSQDLLFLQIAELFMNTLKIRCSCKWITSPFNPASLNINQGIEEIKQHKINITLKMSNDNSSFSQHNNEPMPVKTW